MQIVSTRICLLQTHTAYIINSKYIYYINCSYAIKEQWIMFHIFCNCLLLNNQNQSCWSLLRLQSSTLITHSYKLAAKKEYRYNLTSLTSHQLVTEDIFRWVSKCWEIPLQRSFNVTNVLVRSTVDHLWNPTSSWACRVLPLRKISLEVGEKPPCLNMSTINIGNAVI